MQSIQFRWIQAFRAVALTGTTTGAAKMLNVGQSAISKHLAALEGRLGVTLFDRTRRGLQLTNEGQALFAEADTALEGVQRFRRIAEDLRQARRGHIHIVAAANLARGLLPEALTVFRRKSPASTVSIDVIARREARARIEGQHFDLALLALPFDYPPESSIAIGVYPGVCILPLDHPLAKRKALRVGDLSDIGLICLPGGTIGRMHIEQLFGSHGMEPAPAIEASSAIAELVAAGLGAAIVDPFTARAARPDRIVVRQIEGDVFYRYGILLPVNKTPSILSKELAKTIARVAKSIKREVS